MATKNTKRHEKGDGRFASRSIQRTGLHRIFEACQTRLRRIAKMGMVSGNSPEVQVEWGGVLVML